MQLPSGFFIHPSGADHNIKEYVNILRKVHGDKQGKQFRIWVDDLLATPLGSDTWLVKFDKWELSGMILHNFLLFMLFSFPTPLYLKISNSISCFYVGIGFMNNNLSARKLENLALDILPF